MRLKMQQQPSRRLERDLEREFDTRDDDQLEYERTGRLPLTHEPAAVNRSTRLSADERYALWLHAHPNDPGLLSPACAPFAGLATDFERVI